MSNIYYLLKEKQHSSFHRLKADEIWSFYDGSPLNIYIIDKTGNLKTVRLGHSFKHGDGALFQF